jgi:hypothetical protein
MFDPNQPESPDNPRDPPGSDTGPGDTTISNGPNTNLITADQIQQLYREMLNRPASQSEVNQLLSGSHGFDEVRRGLVNSQEYRNLYYPDRPGEPSQPYKDPNTGQPTPTGGGTPDPTGPGGPPISTSRSPNPGIGAPTDPNQKPPWDVPPPEFKPPTYNAPPAFSFHDFQAPDPNDVWNDPSFRFRFDAGNRALTNSAAARGVMNTGDTLKDFQTYGQQEASQEYGNVWDRAARTYQMDRGNALDTYNTNYGTQYKDPFTFNYNSARDQFAPKLAGWQTDVQVGQHQADQTQLYDWNKYVFDQTQKNTDRSMDFDEWYRRLLLQYQLSQ